MKNQELTYEYEIGSSEISLLSIWNHSRKLREEDSLIIRGNDYSITLGKNDLHRLINEEWLGRKIDYNFLEKLKNRLCFCIYHGLQDEIESTINEIKEFKNRHILPINNK
jgi:hypothetical protein